MTNNKETIRAEVGASEPAATLELVGTGHSAGVACSTLTPAIKAGLQELQNGQILLVRVDDPTARLDVPAWCVLTGNTLQMTAQDEKGVLEFYIRKESRR